MAGTPGQFGVTISDGVPALYGKGATDFAGAIQAWNALLGSTATAGKIFLPVSAYPTTVSGFPAAAKMNAMIAQGYRIYLCYAPGGSVPANPFITQSSTERTNLVASVTALGAACAAAGTGATVAGVIFYQEVNDASHNIPAGNGTNDGGYIGCVNYYGDPAAGVKSIAAAAGFFGGLAPRLGGCSGSGAFSQNAAYFNPGAAQTVPYDFFMTDFYGSAYNSGSRLDAATNGPDTIARALGIPLALGEAGSASGTAVPSNGTVTAYIQHIQTIFTARLTASLTNAEVMWFDGQFTPVTSRTIASGAGTVVGSASATVLNTTTAWPTKPALPGTNVFIQVRTEIMQVLGGSGTGSLTVKRGVQGTAAISTIAAGDTVSTLPNGNNIITLSGDFRLPYLRTMITAITAAGTSTGFAEVQDSNSLGAASGAYPLWFNQGAPSAAASAAGTLLLARFVMDDGAQTITAPAGWSKVSSATDASTGGGTSGIARTEIWAYPANPGGFGGSQAVTATSASPCVFTVTGAAPLGGTAVTLSGTRPGGFANNTVFYVVSPTGSTFQLAATVGGTPINSTTAVTSGGVLAFPVVFTYSNTGATVRGHLTEYSSPAGTTQVADQQSASTAHGTGTSAAPYNVCNGSAAAGSGTLQVTVGTGSNAPQGAAVGDLVYVAAGLNISTNAVTSVTDSQANTYTLAVSNTSNTSPSWIYASKITTALVSGTDWIKITYTTTTGAKSLIARGCTGVTSVTADKTNSGAAGASTAPNSGSTGVLTQASELVVCAITDASSGGTPTGLSFGTGVTVNPSNFLTVFDEVVSATTAQTGSATTTSTTWSASIATFKVTGGSGGMAVTCGGANTQAGGMAAAIFGVVQASGTTGESISMPVPWSTDGPANNLALSYTAFTQTGLAAGTTSGTATYTPGTWTLTAWAASMVTFYATAMATPVNVTTTTLPNGASGVAYSQSLAATGGTSPYTWTLSAGSLPLPAGITLSTAGLLAGTTTVPGAYAFNVTATDNTGASDTQDLTLTITGALSITTVTPMPAGNVGTAYSQTLTAAGGTAPYTFTVPAGLPPGLSLAAGGALTGTPTLLGTYVFSATVTDNVAAQAVASLTISIAAALPPGITAGGGNPAFPQAGWPQLIVEAGFYAPAPVVFPPAMILDDPVNGLLNTGTLSDAVAWTDITQYVRSGSVTRANSRVQGPLLVYQAGTGSVILDNTTGRFDPDNLAGPYVTGGVSSVRPMVPFRVRATFASVEYKVFGGFADNWAEGPVAYDAGYSEFTVSGSDGFKILAGITIPPGAPVGPGEQSGTRISRILAAASWFTDHQKVAAGDSAVQATSYGDTALNLLQLTADSEIGELYIDGAGFLVFRNRHAILTDPRSTTVQAAFGDLPGTVHGSLTELAFAAVGRANDDTQLANDIQITRVGGLLQQADDDGSIATYLFPRSYARSDILLTSDPEALGYAQWVLNVSLSATDRFDTLVIDPIADPPNLFPQVLGREIGDLITVYRRPQNSATVLAKPCFIRGISHAVDVVNGTWQTTWDLQDATRYQGFFLLDDANLGKLSSANKLAY